MEAKLPLYCVVKRRKMRRKMRLEKSKMRLEKSKMRLEKSKMFTHVNHVECNTKKRKQRKVKCLHM